MMNRKKKSDRIANPFAVRAYFIVSTDILVVSNGTHNDSVIPGEYGQFIQSSNKIPPRSDVAGYEDRKGED